MAQIQRQKAPTRPDFIALHFPDPSPPTSWWKGVRKLMEGKNTEDREQEGIHKIAITKDGERALSEVVERVYEGYAGGRASRMSVASWVLMQFARGITALDIKNMRLEFLNEISLLELCLKRSKEQGKLSPELKKLLLQQMGLLDEPVRRGAKVKVADDAESDALKEVA